MLTKILKNDNITNVKEKTRNQNILRYVHSS